MTSAVFFWYIFPLIVAGGTFAWIMYDRSHHDDDKSKRSGRMM